jgi:hypothetical protein
MACRKTGDVVVGDVDQVTDEVGGVGKAVTGEAIAKSRQGAGQKDNHQVAKIRPVETIGYFFHGRIITSRCFDQ